MTFAAARPAWSDDVIHVSNPQLLVGKGLSATAGGLVNGVHTDQQCVVLLLPPLIALFALY